MRKSKKALTLLLSLSMVVSVTACSSKPEENVSDSDQNVSVEVDTNDTETTQEAAENIYSADVIIVGAGGAGLSAAIEAAKSGASVIILEKASAVGGNTLATQSGINAVGTDVQVAAGVEVSEEEFIANQTNDYANPTLVEFFTDTSADAIAFLESLGMEFSLDKRNNYTHVDASGNTTAITAVEVLYNQVRNDNTTVLTNTTATSLIETDGVVTGVVAVNAQGETMIFHGNAIVLATGGYGQNSELVYENNASLTGAITDEIAPTTGDGLIMATALGAATVDLDKFTTFPIVEATTHQMIFPMMVPGDSIFVNSEGARFAAEKFGSEDVVNAMLAEGTVNMIFDQKFMDSTPSFQKLYAVGAVTEGATIAELAANLGIDASALSATVEQWNMDVEDGTDSQFGRDVSKCNTISEGAFYSIEIGVGVHYCLGGLVINTDTQVLDTEGNAISGLYAAGEVTGGVHGDNKVDGSTFADSIVFGYQTGIQSAAYALSKGTMELVVPAVSNEVTIEAQGNYENGVYEGSGTGRGGEIKVQVTVEGGNITDITVVSNEETASIFEGVETSLIPEIIRTQNPDTDAVAGATLSSNGVIEAVKNALGL